MRKFIAFVLFVLMSVYSGGPIVAKAEGPEEYRLNLVADEIDNINITVYLMPVKNFSPLYCGYTVSEGKELDYIVYLMNTWKLYRYDKMAGMTDSDYYIMSVTKKNGEVMNIGYLFDTYVWIDDIQYRMEQLDVDEFYYFVYFVYGLYTGDIVLPEEMTFEPSIWAKNDISRAVEEGLVPEHSRIDYIRDITRLEAAHITANFININGVQREYYITTPFRDINDSSVKYLWKQKIMIGKSDMMFCPYDLINREEFAKVLYNTYEFLCGDVIQNVQDIQYNDQNSISDWALESVNQLTALGIFKGDEEGNFDPKKNITKEEVIIAMLRLNDMLN